MTGQPMTGWPASVSGPVVWTVTGGPDGDVAVPVPGAPTDGEVLLTLTTPSAEAAAVAAGRLDPNTAYMQGRLKVTGPTGPLLDLLAYLRGSGNATLRDALGAALGVA